MKKLISVLALLLAVTALVVYLVMDAPANTGPAHNMLSEQEAKEGWQLLFDGKTTQNWHNYGKQGVGAAWQVDSGALHLYVPQRAGNKAPGGGDLVTDEVYSGDFELKLDWKIDRLGNSGIFLFVTEDTAYQEIYHTGMELQIFDDAIYEGMEEENNHRAGDIFALASAGGNTVHPVGEWNKVRVLHQNGLLKVYMNNVMIHNIDLHTAEWNKAIAGSGLKAAPISKGQYKGRIGLQDWGSQVWYRNIKIRKI